METNETSYTLTDLSASTLAANAAVDPVPSDRAGAHDEYRALRYQQYTRLMLIIAKFKKDQYPSAGALKRYFDDVSVQVRHNLRPVGERTVRRDLKLLRESYNAPIEYCPDAKGWALTDAYWALPCVELPDEELLAVLLVQKVLRGRLPQPLRGSLDAAVESLVAASKASMEEVHRLLDAVVVVNDPPPEPPANPAAVAAAMQAFRDCQPLEIRYATGSGQVLFHNVELHALFLQGDAWFFRAKTVTGTDGQPTNWTWLSVNRIVAARGLGGSRFVRERSAAQAAPPSEAAALGKAA